MPKRAVIVLKSVFRWRIALYFGIDRDSAGYIKITASYFDTAAEGSEKKCAFGGLANLSQKHHGPIMMKLPV
jgi:hypothetical protein